MRIVSGFLKGRRFDPPASFKARPTTDFAKENLFNVLNNRVDFESLKVLDLFGGTGSISYEFASRGCTNITCVEMNGLNFGFIKKSVEQLGLRKEIQVVKGDVFKFCAKSSETFDLIFADPPYDLKTAPQLPDLIMGGTLLKADGLFIMEHSDKVSYAHHPCFKEVRDYGKVNFSFFER
jgi:16S rRNA (guanine(966)-N(2))-methyltransferase RsmD